MNFHRGFGQVVLAFLFIIGSRTFWAMLGGGALLLVAQCAFAADRVTKDGDALPLNNTVICRTDGQMTKVLEYATVSFEAGMMTLQMLVGAQQCIVNNHAVLYRLDEVRPGTWDVKHPDGSTHPHYLAKVSYINVQKAVFTGWTFLRAEIIERGIDSVLHDKDA